MSQNKKAILVLIIISFFTGLLILNCPFLGKKDLHQKELFLKMGKLIIVSDLHLESNFRDLSCIGDFIDKNKISTLIFNGDVFDRKHKEIFQRDDFKKIEERLGIENGSLKKLIYITAYNHDPYLKEDFMEFKEGEKEFLVFGGLLKLKTSQDLFYIFHGDYITIAPFPTLINKLSASLSFEKLAKKIIGAKREDWLILGHSHLPGIDPERKIANPGSWIKRIVENSDSAILIELNQKLKVNLIKIPCQR